MPDQDLKLNSLSRYTKQSPRLVLEEHGSCEVPAGCGGVVLRWRNPVEPIPMILHLSFWWNGEREQIALDGKDTEYAARTPVTFGTHVLTMIVRDFDPAYAVVLMTGRLDAEYVRVLQLEGDMVFLSVPDNTWRYTLKPPEGDGWQRPDFDDRSWQPMVQKPFAPPPKNSLGDASGWTKDLTDQGAVGLGIETTPSLIQQIKTLLTKNSSLPTVYIRKTFTVSRPRPEEERS
jgi:hypothetical protein